VGIKKIQLCVIQCSFVAMCSYSEIGLSTCDLGLGVLASFNITDRDSRLFPPYFFVKMYEMLIFTAQFLPCSAVMQLK